MPSPPPASRSRSWIPVSASSRQSSAARAAASNTGSASSSWEAIWEGRPTGPSDPFASPRPGPLEANLARGAPSGEIFVAPAGDVGIQPDRDWCGAPEHLRGASDLVELFERLDVERADPALARRADLALALADAGEDDPARRDPRRQAFRELAAGDDIGTEPFGRDHPQDRERVGGLGRGARR